MSRLVTRHHVTRLRCWATDGGGQMELNGEYVLIAARKACKLGIKENHCNADVHTYRLSLGPW